MSSDVIDQVRLLAVDVDATTDVERARQRRKLTGAISAEATLPIPAGVFQGRRRRPALQGVVGSVRTLVGSRRRAYLAGAVAAVASAGIAIPLSLVGGGTAAAVLTSAHYSLRLPPQYHLTAATTSDCHPFLMWAPSPSGGSDASEPSYATGDAAAATASGGCVSMVLASPYTPTASLPDPEAVVAKNPSTQYVQVGPYDALIFSGMLVYQPTTHFQINGTVVYVEIPLSDGQVQDLVVGAKGLSQSQLIDLVATGLSVPPGIISPTAATSGNTGTSGSAVGNSGAGVN